VGLFCLAVVAVAHGAVVVHVQDPSAPQEIIDLASWRNRDGRTLAEISKGHSLSMLVLVSPDCSTCTTDTLPALRGNIEKAKIAYYVVMIPTGTDAQKYFSYADSLKIGADSFVWSNGDVKPPAFLTTLPALSHVLVTNEGHVVNKWSGIPDTGSSQ